MDSIQHIFTQKQDHSKLIKALTKKVKVKINNFGHFYRKKLFREKNQPSVKKIPEVIIFNFRALKCKNNITNIYVKKVFAIRNLLTPKLRTWNFFDEQNHVFKENSFSPGRLCISYLFLGHPANILLVKIYVKPMISWKKETPCKLDHYCVHQRA